ncbi:hypothetical protein B0H13DRAFT_2353952 [Mycena leptocephala]|nr:hypothetical protein B0H13DRAFT_2353952 [Mycena leptocephala]
MNDPNGLNSGKSDIIIDNVKLSLVLAEQVAGIAEAPHSSGAAAKLLSSIIASYKEVKSANQKRDVLTTRIADLTGDLCATILRMEAIKYSDSVGRLKDDLHKYAALIKQAAGFVDEYDKQGKFVRAAARNQFGDDIDKLNQDLNTFGDHFRTNRLVDLTISQRVNTATLNQVHGMAVEEKLEKWLLNPPDMKQKQSNTEKLRTGGTGGWLLEDNRFIEWQDRPGFLWLEGPSGVGKSVLSSAVIKQLFEENQNLSDGGGTTLPAIAYFYFDFVHEDRRSAESALRRIILQLSAQSPHPYETLNEAHQSFSRGQATPSFEKLHKILEEILRGLSRAYIVLDGLDECDDPDQVTDVVSRLRNWTESPLHLFVAGQPRSIFTERFQAATPVYFHTSLGDIHRFVTHELAYKDKLKIWRPYSVHIANEVTNKSSGMFRLAAMLLIELSKCKLVHKLDEILKNLPVDLFAVYDRFFESLSSHEWVYVDAVLRWIMFSFEPLTLDQLPFYSADISRS